ncbi:MAG TPA: TetR/AcrR family transcriptional regulator [Candidatus Nanopelagicales bacterium]|nr:TetR/AcrR family transcriptional regulator [Candidatus Nanopelagicales bacterium]
MPTTERPPRHEVPPPYGTTDTYHHGNLRAACLEAGIRLVEEEGPDAVTIRGVARIAGVSHTAPLHHFHDRQALLDAVANRGFELLVERLDASLAPDATPTAALRAYGRAYVDHAVAHRGLFALMFRPTAEMQGEASYRRLIEHCAAAQAAGELPGDDPFRLALVLWSSVHGLAALYATSNLGSGHVTGQPTDPGVGTDAVLDDVLGALAAATTQKETPR